MATTLASDADVLSDIENFCERRGMPPTTFGRLAIGDPNLVASMKANRSLTLKTAGRVVAFMAQHDADAARIILCALCERRTDDPCVRSCTEADCPQVEREAA